MRIKSIHPLPGPNVYSHAPMLVMLLDLEDLTQKESYDVPGFIERLLALLPGLSHHHCSKGRPGGFVERLSEGTYFGHTVEHVALELTVLAEVPTVHGKTRRAGAPNLYNVAIEYKAEQATRYLLETAVELVEALVKGEHFPLEERLRVAMRIAADKELGPSTRGIVEAAARRLIPWMRLNDESLVQLGYGKYRHFVQAAMSDATGAVPVEVAGDKDLTKSLLEKASIPVPRGRIVSDPDQAVTAMQELGPPVVVKPLNGRQGKGVSLDLSTPEEVRQAFEVAAEYSPDVLVEELFRGRNYRVLVINGRVVAASERLPCQVIGDGVHNVAELIEMENKNPLRGEGHEKPLTQIKLDPILLAFMQKAEISLQDVPEAGKTIMLCAGMNLSTGGTAKDVTDELHPSIRSLCQRAARAVGLDICGVDLVMNDISEPLAKEGEGVIELNAAPGLRMHMYPGEGKPRDVGAAITDMLYPEGATGRIPIISITGTNGKTTVTRMIGFVLQRAGHTVGLTTTDGIWIGGEKVIEGDTTGPISARTVLSDPTVDIAVLETARGGIVRRGLGYDWSDISVMTNIKADHIGQDGIESVEDLVYIKSLVAERVREGGTLILNADDERLMRLRDSPAVRRVKKRIVLFSLDADNEEVRSHLAEGGTAYFLRGGWIAEADGQGEHLLIEADAVPVTQQGTARYQVANILAAFAACRAQGCAVEQINESLMSFRNEAQNPGRTNLYKVGGGYVLVDYGHNPDAFEEVSRMAARWQGLTVTAIVGVPGDRDDRIIEEAGAAAAKGFHRIFIKEDKDLRGRKPGEVAGLLCRVITQAAPDRSFSVVLDEVEAFSKALREIKRGEVVIIFYDKLAPILELLAQAGAVPANAEDMLGSYSTQGTT